MIIKDSSKRINDNTTKRLEKMSRANLLYRNCSNRKNVKEWMEFEDKDEIFQFAIFILDTILYYGLRELPCYLSDIVSEVQLLYLAGGKTLSIQKITLAVSEIVYHGILGRGIKDEFKNEVKFYDYLNEKAIVYPYTFIRTMIDKEQHKETFFLTEEGYDFMISHLEIKDNLKYSVHDLIIKMIFEYQDYDKLVDRIEEVIMLSKRRDEHMIQLMSKMRRDFESVAFTMIEKENRSFHEMILKQMKNYDEYSSMIYNKINLLEQMDNYTQMEVDQVEDLQNLNEAASLLKYVVASQSKPFERQKEMMNLRMQILKERAYYTNESTIDFQEVVLNTVLKEEYTVEHAMNLMLGIFTQQPNRYFDMVELVKKQQRPQQKEEIKDTRKEDEEQRLLQLQQLKEMKVDFDEQVYQSVKSFLDVVLREEKYIVVDQLLCKYDVSFFGFLLEQLLQRKGITFSNLKKQKNLDTQKVYDLDRALLRYKKEHKDVVYPSLIRLVNKRLLVYEIGKNKEELVEIFDHLPKKLRYQKNDQHLVLMPYVIHEQAHFECDAFVIIKE